MAATQDPTAPAGDADAQTSAPPSPDDQAPKAALRDLGPRLKELAEYISYFLSAKWDGVKVSVRNAGIYAALGLIGLLAASAFVVTTVVLLCLGVARGLTALFGGRAWAGDLAAALLFLAILGVALWIGVRKLTAASRERTVRKYASRQQHQRATFGTDVSQRSQNPAK